MPPEAQAAQAGAAPADKSRADARVDGVICFGGEDWWYHNRGHFDMQLMRELSARVPVLYVNSIGMRVPRPSEGAMFLTRVRRKLRSLRRGLVQVRPQFAVLSPLAGPGRLGRFVSRAFMPGQILRAARSIGIRKPLLWVACPPGADSIDRLRPQAVVYQRTDKFEEFPHVDRCAIEGNDRLLKDRAVLTLFCSRLLYEAERTSCRNALFVDHGVDFDRFHRAGLDPVANEPVDLRPIGRPRAGFVGGIDAHTFDPPLFEQVVGMLPDVQFVLVGGCSLPEQWLRDHPNVHFLGQKPYEEVAGYMAGCDVLLMPWNRSDWIRACNPIKLKEYLATGRPVVSTSYDELLRTWRDHVAVADGAAAFAEAIRAALRAPGDAEARRRRVERETWTAKADQVVAALATLGIGFCLGADEQ